jgi:hypothetical protein
MLFGEGSIEGHGEASGVMSVALCR